MKTTNTFSLLTGPFEQHRVRNLQNLGILDSEPDPYFDELIRLASVVMETPMGALSFIDQDRQWFMAKIGLDVSETSRDVSFCTHTILHPSRPMVVSDATESLRFKNNPFVVSGPKIRAYAGIPINSPDFGLTIGSLCVIDTKPRNFTATQLKILTEIATSVQVGLEQRWLKKKFSLAS